MIPLGITAELATPVCLSYPLHLDGMLAYAVAHRDQLPMALLEADLQAIEVPLQMETNGRFHLCSAAEYDVYASELRYTNRRPPLEQYQTLADTKLKRCKINVGANKAYRIPRHVDHVDCLIWWCLGDPDAIEALLPLIHHIGKRRGVGWGKVVRWSVEEVDSWGQDFPVVAQQKPLRNLPLDWPNLDSPATGMANLTYPYWLRSTETMCAVPR